MTTQQIVYENGGSYVLLIGPGHYEVYRHEQTHAVRAATYHFKDQPDYSFGRAKQRCDELSAA